MEKTPIPIANQMDLEMRASEAFEKYKRGRNSRGIVPLKVSNRTLSDYLTDLGNILESKYYQDQVIIQQNREILQEMKAYKEITQTMQYLTTHLK